jgi:hypothetical protein
MFMKHVTMIGSIIALLFLTETSSYSDHGGHKGGQEKQSSPASHAISHAGSGNQNHQHANHQHNMNFHPENHAATNVRHNPTLSQSMPHGGSGNQNHQHNNNQISHQNIQQNNMNFHQGNQGNNQGHNNYNNNRNNNHNNHNNNVNSEFFPFYPVYPIVSPDYGYYDYDSAPASDDSYFGGNDSFYDSSDNNSAVSSSSSVAQYPNGNWVSADNGNVPNNAIVYNNTNTNGISTYYCRADYNGQTYYGLLVPNEGCYVQDQTVSIRFNTYDVLVSQ